MMRISIHGITSLLMIACLPVSMLGQTAAGEEPAVKGSSKTVIYKTVGPRKLRLDIDLPPGWKSSDQRPAIVFWSGGGFRNGGTEQFQVHARYFADRGMVAFRAEYRDRTKDKATIHVCTQDAASAMRWIRAHASDYGVHPSRIVTSGGSAGGFLAAAICSVPPDLHGEADDLSVSPKPNAMVLFNPALALRSSDAKGNSAGGRGRERSLQDELNGLSPIYRLKKGFPPTLILIGSLDPFLKVSQEFCEKARQDGARAEIEVYEGQRHSFFNYGQSKPETIKRADRFLQEIGYLESDPKVALPPPGPERSRARRGRDGRQRGQR